MIAKPFRRSALLLAGAALLVPFASAQAAGCGTANAQALSLGTVMGVAAGAQRNFTLVLGSGEGVLIDLASVTPPAPRGGDDHDDRAAATAPRSVTVCDARGGLLAPQPGEVFDKGGSYSTTDEGERLRFVAPLAGQYKVSVAAGDAPRELLVRRREIGAVQAQVVASALGRTMAGSASSAAPKVYSFTAPAGQWVELKSVSDKDTVLRLAGPDREGAYSVIAENDDSDGLNPRIRRKLAVAGTYYVQVDSLSDEPGDFEFTASRIDAPKPPPPPAALRLGAATGGRFGDQKDVAIYSLAVVAGHGYRIEVAAPYDAALAIGLPNPIEPDNGDDGPDAGFSEVKAQDSGTTGTEKLNFTARATGTLLVKVKNFGIGESDGAFTLTASDLGN